MGILKAKPNENVVYNALMPRVSVQINQQLELLKHHDNVKYLDNIFRKNIEGIFVLALPRMVSNAFVSGAKDVKYAPDSILNIRLHREAKDRSKIAAQLITDTTGEALGLIQAMSRSRALSKGRADLIAVNEVAMQFFRGVRYGWGLNPLAGKSWHVSDGHDKDDICDENEEVGLIGVDDEFPSGDQEPPAHIACDCFMTMAYRRIK